MGLPFTLLISTPPEALPFFSPPPPSYSHSFIVSFPPLSPSIAAAVSTVLGATDSEREPAYLHFVPAEGEIKSL